MIRFLLDFFYPKKCIFCGERINEKDVSYCKKCYYKIPILNDTVCLICGRELYSDNGYRICTTCQKHKMHFDINYPCFIYEGNIKESILKYKFAGQMWYYKQLSNFIYENIKNKIKNIDYIVYPPTNKNTFGKRGYNHVELMAVEIGKKFNIKVIKNAIYKIKDNEKQSLMSASMRFKNVKGVFKVKEKYEYLLKDKRILFIDDVLTTGATADECAKILKKAGAKYVCCATVCITR